MTSIKSKMAIICRAADWSYENCADFGFEHREIKGSIHTMVVQLAMLYGMETAPMTSSHVKKLEVTMINMCKFECDHRLSDH